MTIGTDTAESSGNQAHEPSGSSSVPSPVLDSTKLALLEGLIGSAKCAAALRKFKAELGIRIAEIDAIATSPEDKAKHAHKLAGAAGILGLLELTDKCRSLLAAVHQNVDDLRPYIDELVRAAGRAATAIKPLGE